MAVTFIIVIIVGGRRLNASIDSTLITYQGTIGCVGGGLKAPEFQSRSGSPALFSPVLFSRPQLTAVTQEWLIVEAYFAGPGRRPPRTPAN